MASLLGFAVVGADGTLLHASGVQRVVRADTGSYNIYFNFSVANACEIASIGHFQTPGWITAYGEPPLGDNEVSVWVGNWEWSGEITQNGDVAGVLVPVNADLTFQLAVFG